AARVSSVWCNTPSEKTKSTEFSGSGMWLRSTWMKVALSPRSSKRVLATSTAVETSTPTYRIRSRTGSNNASADAAAPHPASSNIGRSLVENSQGASATRPYFSTSHADMARSGPASKVSRFAHLKPNVSLVCRWAADPTSSDRRIPPAFAYTCPSKRTEPPSGGNGTSSNSPNHAGIATSRTTRDLAKAVHHIRVIVVRHAVVKGDRQGIA